MESQQVCKEKNSQKALERLKEYLALALTLAIIAATNQTMVIVVIKEEGDK